MVLAQKNQAYTMIWFGLCKSIMLLDSPIILPGILFKFTYYSQNYSHTLEIIPIKAALYKIYINILIKHKQYI